MSYSKTTWQTGDTVTAELLNHMEDGISDADAKVLPAVSGSDNGKVLQVKNGAWTKGDAIPSPTSDLFGYGLTVKYGGGWEMRKTPSYIDCSYSDEIGEWTLTGGGEGLGFMQSATDLDAPLYLYVDETTVEHEQILDSRNYYPAVKFYHTAIYREDGGYWDVNAHILFAKVEKVSGTPKLVEFVVTYDWDALTSYSVTRTETAL